MVRPPRLCYAPHGSYLRTLRLHSANAKHLLYHSTNAEGPCSNTVRIPCSCQTAPGWKIRSQRTDRECDIRVSFVLCVRVTVDKHFAEFEFSSEKKIRSL